MGDNVGDDDGTSRTPHTSLLALPALPALPCATVCLGLFCLYFRVQRKGNVVEAFECIQRAIRRDQTTATEPMRSTLLNTYQPRIAHSEYHDNF